jgi:hypothetical protein
MDDAAWDVCLAIHTALSQRSSVSAMGGTLTLSDVGLNADGTASCPRTGDRKAQSLSR